MVAYIWAKALPPFQNLLEQAKTPLSKTPLRQMRLRLRPFLVADVSGIALPMKWRLSQRRKSLRDRVVSNRIIVGVLLLRLGHSIIYFGDNWSPQLHLC